MAEEVAIASSLKRLRGQRSTEIALVRSPFEIEIVAARKLGIVYDRPVENRPLQHRGKLLNGDVVCRKKGMIDASACRRVQRGVTLYGSSGGALVGLSLAVLLRPGKQAVIAAVIDQIHQPSG